MGVAIIIVSWPETKNVIRALTKIDVLKKIIAPIGRMDAIEFINSKLRDTKNNSVFFNSMNKPV